MKRKTRLNQCALLAKGATYALIGVSLAACGGSGGGTATTPAASPSALNITESNAPAVTNELIQAATLLPMIPESYYGISSISCDAGGSANTTGNPGSPQSTITISQCKPVYDSTEKVVYDGTLIYQFSPGSASPPYPLSVSIQNLTGSDVMYDSSGNPQNSYTVNINADFTANSMDNVGVNGDFYMSQTDATNSGNNMLEDWSFKNYQTNTDTSGMGPDNITGQQTLNDLGGYVDITTAQDLTYDSSVSTCPLTGQITAQGAGNSYVQVNFNGGDAITVTVNGNANSYNCSDFQSWIGTISAPLSLSKSSGGSASTARSWSTTPFGH